MASETETFINNLTFPPEGTKRVPTLNDSTVPGSVPLPYPFRFGDSAGKLGDFLLQVELSVRVIGQMAALDKVSEPGAKLCF